MPSPSLPPSNAVSNDRPCKGILGSKHGADSDHTCRALKGSHRTRNIAPAKRAKPNAAPAGSRPVPVPSIECPRRVEQVLVTERPRRHIRGPSKRYQNFETKANADADADPEATESKGKSSNTENQSANSIRMPMPCETRNMQEQQPATAAARVLPGRRSPQAKDAGQSSSMAKKAKLLPTLTKEEITEDFAAMNLLPPARRRREVPNSRFMHLIPGSGLPKSVTPSRYVVKGRG